MRIDHNTSVEIATMLLRHGVVIDLGLARTLDDISARGRRGMLGESERAWLRRELAPLLDRDLSDSERSLLRYLGVRAPDPKPRHLSLVTEE